MYHECLVPGLARRPRTRVEGGYIVVFFVVPNCNCERTLVGKHAVEQHAHRLFRILGGLHVSTISLRAHNVMAMLRQYGRGYVSMVWVYCTRSVLCLFSLEPRRGYASMVICLGVLYTYRVLFIFLRTKSEAIISTRPRSIGASRHAQRYWGARFLSLNKHNSIHFTTQWFSRCSHLLSLSNAGKLQQDFGISVGGSNFLDLDSSTPKKFSRHLIVHLPGDQVRLCV